MNVVSMIRNAVDAWRRKVNLIGRRGLDEELFLKWCAQIEGVEYGDWITEDGRSVGGISSGDRIDSFPHAIEFLLREELAYPTEEIDTDSFDTAFSALPTSDWVIQGTIQDQKPAGEHIENILQQCKSRLFKNDEGKWEVSVYNSAASVDYSDYKFDKDANISNFNISRTPLENIINNIRVKYKKNPSSGNFEEETWIKCTKEYSGSMLNGSLNDSDTTGITVDDGTDFNTSTRSKIMIDDETMTISSISTNDLSVFARGQFGSTARSHADNSRIFVLLEDSSDNDTTREQNAITTGHTYKTFKEMVVEADMIIDDTTAINLRNHLFDYYRVPHWIVEFETFLNVSDLKITNVIEFNDSIMDSWLKLAGQSWSGKKFEVVNIKRMGKFNYKITAVEL